MIKILQASIRMNCLLKRSIFSMATQKFVLPDLGQKIKEGTISKIYVKQGQRVNQMDDLAQVKSDKQNSDITAPYSGRITKIHYKVDDIIQVGSVFFQFQTQNQPNPSLKQEIKQIKTHDKVKSQETKNIQNDVGQKGQYQIIASSTVKMLAKQYKIELKRLKGTGRKGRILKDDIIFYLQDLKKNQISVTKQQLKPKIINQQTKTAIQSKPLAVKMNEKQISLCKMINYSSTIPHLYYQQIFDVTQLKKTIGNISSSEKNTKNISLFSILLKTFSLALKKYPQLNSIYQLANSYAYNVHHHHNIAVPLYKHQHMSFNLINNLNGLNIYEIQQHLNEPYIISQQELNSSTILVSNIGEQGAMAMNPVIYGNTVCHANIGSVRQLSSYLKNQLTKRYMIQITMGCDHRVLDGATVARFTSEWRQLSQNPTLAFLNMI